MATFTADDYTVGWITALPGELKAATAMLDEQHSPLPQPPRDDNSYRFGRIGAHNVVIACLPLGRIGKVPAGLVAKDMWRSFPNVQCGLLVGIGGGIPTEEMDMRLGDIAVSKPGYNDGGIVQYDYGQTVKKGRFIRSGTLNQPPSKLLTALATIQESHSRKKLDYVRIIENVKRKNPTDFFFPSARDDRLFHANYDHVADRPTCDRCSNAETKQRPPRTDAYPSVFYGTIASADRVMRHGPTRDKIGKETGAICFEMEAAGLMNDFPCVVIRGISDYSDTHKNYQWQSYAALTAAAYAKDLLQYLSLPAETVSFHSNITSPSNPGKGHVRSAVETVTSISAQATVSNLHSFFVIDPKVLHSPSVALGRLVTNIKAPWDEYCPDGPKPEEGRVGISPDSLLQDLLENPSSEALKARLQNVLMFLKTPKAGESMKPIRGKSYFLTNPRYWLNETLKLREVRNWIEEMIKIEWEIFLVVSIHTVSSSAAYPIPSSDVRDQLTSNEEIIVAVQYRKVKFDWLDELDKKRVQSELGEGLWEPLILTKAATEPDDTSENEILMVSLEAHIDIANLEVENDVSEERDRILVF